LLFDVALRPGEIAEALGYADIYQFSKQFKKTFGVSPTQYRQQQLQRSEGQSLTW
jgi:AraC-like DNA-binding protein